MDYRETIIDLIKEDFKQHQLMYYLEKAGIVVEVPLDLAPLVARFLGYVPPRIPDEYMDTYGEFLDAAIAFDLGDYEGLKKLARRCYEHLMQN